MQFTTVLLAAISASATLATPMYNNVDNSIIVTLIREGRDVNVPFREVQAGTREERAPRHSGPFKKVNLEVGKGVQKQDLRCQVLDHSGKPIIIVRDPNTDITFSDADKGAWHFKEESMVSKVVCDPTFVKAGADALDVTVILSGPGDLATQTVFSKFDGKHAMLPPRASFGPYDTVELQVGALVTKQDLRCQIIASNGEPVIIKRVDNVDKTFSDAKKGAWKFVKPTEAEIKQIVCNPDFVAEKVQI